MTTTTVGPIALISIGIVIVILLFIACVHFCLADSKLGNIRLRIIMIISLVFELLLIITYYISSINTDTNKWLHYFPNIFRYLNMVMITIIAYYLVKCPNIGMNQSKFVSVVNHFWLFVSAIHLLWILNCMLFTIFDDQNSNIWQRNYFFGLSIYLLFGIMQIFIISFKLKEQITESLLKLDRMNHSKYEDYVYDDDDDDDNAILSPKCNNDANTPETPTSDDNKSEKSDAKISMPTSQDGVLSDHQQQNRTISALTSKDINTTLDKIVQLNSTKSKVNMSLCFISLFFIFIVFSFYWEISNFSAMIDSFILNYITVIILYTFITGYNWVSFKNVSVDSLKCKLQKSPSLSLKLKSNSMVISNIFRKGQSSPAMIKSPAQNDNDNDNDNDNVEHRTSFTTTLKEDTTTERMVGISNSNGYNGNRKLKVELSKQNDSIVSYTEQERAELSRTHLNVDLKNINSRGEIIGKRGVAKPKKVTRRRFSSREYDSNTKLDLNNLSSITELETESIMDDGASMLSGTEYENTAKMENFVDDVLDQMSFTDTAKITPINTIVFEFGNVLCTQIEKLNGKTQLFLSSKDLLHKQLYFGGEERIETLKNWLYDLKKINANNDLKFFVNTEQETKVIIQLRVLI